MSITMDEEIKRWTAKRKTALVMDIIQGKTTVSEAARGFDLAPSEIEAWVNDAKQGMENALRAKPLDIREQYEKQLKELQEAYGEAMLELRARKKLASLLGEDDRESPMFSRDYAPRVPRSPSVKSVVGLACHGAAGITEASRLRPRFRSIWLRRSRP